jgi:hypothetical protein
MLPPALIMLGLFGTGATAGHLLWLGPAHTLDDRAGIENVLSASQNLRRGWPTDPPPRFFDPTPPLLADAKTASDQRGNEQWRRCPPPNCPVMSLMLRSIADASYVYPQMHPRTTAINSARSQLGWGKGSKRFQTFYARQD